MYLHEAEAQTADLDLRKRAVFLSGLAISYTNVGDDEAGLVAGLQARALFQTTGVPLEEARVCNWLALAHLRRGSTERAAEMIANAVRLAADIDDPRQLVHFRETEAQVALARGDLETARRLAEEAAAMASATDNPFAGASACTTLATLEMRAGRPDQAAAAGERAVALARRLAGRRGSAQPSPRSPRSRPRAARSGARTACMPRRSGRAVVLGPRSARERRSP